jgi:hypothetical protein
VISSAKDAGLFQKGLNRLSGTVREGLAFFRARTIRRIYANLQRLAAQQGHPRSPQQTPDKYLEQLAQAWPEHRGDFQIITRAYVRAHYGMVSDTREELDRIHAAWQRIRTTGTNQR